MVLRCWKVPLPPWSTCTRISKAPQSVGTGRAWFLGARGNPGPYRVACPLNSIKRKDPHTWMALVRQYGEAPIHHMHLGTYTDIALRHFSYSAGFLKGCAVTVLT